MREHVRVRALSEPSLPFRDNPQSLRDICESIDNITFFPRTHGPLRLPQDRKTQAGVERELQIITEAAIRLGDEADAIYPGPDWRNIRELGNALRHAYDDIDQHILWDTVYDDLPPLREAVEEALSRLERRSTA